MKLIIASDLHGSALYTRRLLNACEREGADKILLLGDLLYHGPRNDLPEGYAPKQVAPMLNGVRNHLLCVRGNCDSEVDQMVLDFPMMAQQAIVYWEDLTLVAVHGHTLGPDNPPPMPADGVLISGHTHVPAFDRSRGFLCVNPGSVSIPKSGSKRGYMVLCARQLTHRALDGATIAEFCL